MKASNIYVIDNINECFNALHQFYQNVNTQ